MDNERPIEKLLRAFAKKRRDDAGKPLEMHPATQRLLQGEISRQLRKTAAGGMSSAGILRRLWPRLAWALPVLLMLGIGAWVLVDLQKPPVAPFELAKNATPPTTKPPQDSARTEARAQPVVGGMLAEEADRRALVSAEAKGGKDIASNRGAAIDKLKTENARTLALGEQAPTVVADSTALRESTAPTRAFQTAADNDRSNPQPGLARGVANEPLPLADGKLAAVPASVPAPATPEPTAKAFASRYGLAGGAARGADAPSTGASAESPAPAQAVPAAVFSDNGISTEKLVQRFVQTPAPRTATRAKPTLKPAQVLDSFQIEQTGNQLRVIDSDGSSYTGSIALAVQELKYVEEDASKKGSAYKLGAKPFVSRPAGEATLNHQAGQNFFRVRGTNRTLRQVVDFSGNFVVMTNLLPANQAFKSLAPATKNQLLQNQADPPILLNSTISGRAQVGAGQELLINAAPAQR